RKARVCVWSRQIRLSLLSAAYRDAPMTLTTLENEPLGESNCRQTVYTHSLHSRWRSEIEDDPEKKRSNFHFSGAGKLRDTEFARIESRGKSCCFRWVDSTEYRWVNRSRRTSFIDSSNTATGSIVEKRSRWTSTS
ncbi:unnamed protein product, partial [Heterotrigona itama]